ncbi:MAG: glycosyltransferase family 4 protein [Methanobacteriota archaeon]
MRVTLVSPFDPFPADEAPGGAHVGGVERVLGSVATEIARRGHEVTFVTSTAARDPVAEERRGRLRVVRRPRRFTVFRAPWAPLAEAVDRGAQVVHVAATYPFTTPSVLSRASRLGIPSILDFHFEPVVEGPAGRLAAALYREIGPRAYPRAARVLVRSRAYGRACPSLAGIPPARWRVVPNGVDPAVFRPNGSGVHGDAADAYLLFVGRLVPYKGMDVLLTALASMREPPRLVVAGDGPLRGALERRAVRLGVRAEFLGRVPDDRLPDLYRGARATVLPSVNGQEAFGITLIESMAGGTPVVASDLPGVGEVAREGGVTASPGDPEALATSIATVLDAELPRGRALAGQVHERYSWRAVTDRLLSVYEEVLCGSSS